MYLVTDSEGNTVGVFTNWGLACEALLDWASQIMDTPHILEVLTHNNVLRTRACAVESGVNVIDWDDKEPGLTIVEVMETDRLV